ncbi:hypothetical protein HanHA300_Chr12g0433931 [Helianthus annuus]|nr:hypothetical protein HanHA300_Chr12g0433931 [Helianthus annuus]KAJ0504374.1 hypothetical protein HanHA89_Chr12g0458581 [Helianthus annuus]KAJ0674083.1 hypothetical protein HanLR1_Chr12g0436061 [Helianthus annuus]
MLFLYCSFILLLSLNFLLHSRWCLPIAYSSSSFAFSLFLHIFNSSLIALYFTAKHSSLKLESHPFPNPFITASSNPGASSQL